LCIIFFSQAQADKKELKSYKNVAFAFDLLTLALHDIYAILSNINLGAGVIPRIHLPRLKFPRQHVHRIVILD
jgi:hypothetical protein